MKEKRRALLSLQDRQSIWMMKSEGFGIREIGRLIGRDPSVVSRELRRNQTPWRVHVKLSPVERAKQAHDSAKRRQRAKRRGRRKARPLMHINQHIADKLTEKWSPEMIANTIGEYFPGLSLSTKTLYRMIKRDLPELVKLLPEKGKSRRARVMNRRGVFQQAAATKRHMSERPQEADDRSEVGHLEGDCIVGTRGGSKVAVLSLCDRKTRRRWYIIAPDLQAATLRKSLVGFLHSLAPEERKTITFDRGSEFADWEMLEKIIPDLHVYFCSAYAPHEKGSVERSNREVRRWYPKGTDFSTVSAEQLAAVEKSINQKPMKCFGWKSSDCVHQQALESQRFAA